MNLCMLPFVRTDVTAVKLLGDLIFAGIGSYTNIFRKSTSKLLARIYTLKGQKIYGFVPSKCGRKVLCFGGKQFVVLSWKDLDGDEDQEWERLGEPVECCDWLHSVVWVKDDSVAVLTAHNSVQVWHTTSQTLLSKYTSCDNSILYSGLLLPIQGDMLVLAGTVFSEIIIHLYKQEKALQRLRGHKGVIFSISCNLNKGFVVSTSDDRSVRFWAPYYRGHNTPDSKEFWKCSRMVCKHVLYGHNARVMRSCVTDDFVVSVGEDAAICFWDHQGELLKKGVAHQNSCIWSVDADEDTLVTGGGDCGVMVHPLAVASEYNQTEPLDIPGAKKVVFTARKNIVIMTEEQLIYYNVKNKETVQYKLRYTAKQKFLSLSPCKQFVAITDIDGNLAVFVEHCKADFLSNFIRFKLELGTLLSMHWSDSRHLVLCSQKGEVTVISKGDDNETVWHFTLPPCKERWLTAALDLNNNMVVLGDRCGNIHFYVKGDRDPIKTFYKVHGRYGPTSITKKDNEVITTGRDGTIRYFSVKDMQVKYMSGKSLGFPWVEKFLDRDENIVCGFQERVFVIYDVRNNRKILEEPCGGGHRAWDVHREIGKVNDKYEECINLLYVKGSDVNFASFQLSKMVSKNIVNASHAKEINCLKCYRNALDASKIYYISGGEDTTLRFSTFDGNMHFTDKVLNRHLSNIRTLKLHRITDNELLLISAGGRAQICLNLLNFDIINGVTKVTMEEVLDYQIKGTDKEKKGTDKEKKGCQSRMNRSTDDPETRIMDVEIVQGNDNEFIIIAGCSDAYLRTYRLKHDKGTQLKVLNELKYHETCILKTHIIRLPNRHILVTCTTRGVASFWNLNFVGDGNNLQAFLDTRSSIFGINSIDSQVISEEEVLVATGRDNNSVHLMLLSVPSDLGAAKLKSALHVDHLHSSQVTGVCFCAEYLVCAAGDQRVSLLRWAVSAGQVACEFVSQVFCDVSDVQGMELVESSSKSITVCVYGKGMEVVELQKSS